jgi:hypothetical protein
MLDGEFPLTGNESALDSLSYNNGSPFDSHGNYRHRTLVASAHHAREQAPALHMTDSQAQTPDLVPDPVDDIACVHAPPSDPPADMLGLPSMALNVSPHLAKASLNPEDLRKLSVALLGRPRSMPVSPVTTLCDATTSLRILHSMSRGATKTFSLMWSTLTPRPLMIAQPLLTSTAVVPLMSSMCLV